MIPASFIVTLLAMQMLLKRRSPLAVFACMSGHDFRRHWWRRARTCKRCGTKEERVPR